MINPNAKHSIKATVAEVIRRSDKTIRDISFKLDSGYILEGVLNLDHKTIVVGERVNITVGFRIMGDCFVVESFRRIKTTKTPAYKAA